MNTEPIDILIAGGGPVGAALALALQDSGHSVVLTEARSAEAGSACSPDSGSERGGKSGDARPIALSYSSRLILERLNAWSVLAATPIETIHVSQQGGFGRTQIRAADCGVPALGYVVTYDKLQQGLLAVPCSGRRMFGAKLTAFDGTTAVVLTQDGEQAFAPRLTVFADGAGVVDDRAVPAYSKDYRQTAVVASVNTAQAHRGRAWERFTPEGPLALLPDGADYGLVWTTSPERAARLSALDTPAFLAQLHAAFGDRLGAFTEAGERSTFPLALRYRRDDTQPHSLCVGNAAQTLHPVAGQGFNLGLRDAWELARLARDARDPGGASFRAHYRRARAPDRRACIQFTDSLVGLFSNSDPLLKLGRGAGLLALDLVPFARRFVARRMIYGANALP
ncbi:MAG: FAD-dependent monooxygenase [Betaproteobacteria bacterium]|nr:FAD-dependent monooxygenase [Betaproteobacteria bacterium]